MKKLLVFSVLISVIALAMTAGGPIAAAATEPPQTEFEESGGANWTTHEGEKEFLEAVDARSGRAKVTRIGETSQGRPMHLVQLGFPSPATRAEALKKPTTLFICSQHGNEPAGREACLKFLRDLAFTKEPNLVRQLQHQTILFIPAANPDGREANTRGNADGTDVNRDHINLATKEAQVVAKVVRDWRPEAVVDLHEYGPSQPVLYDDEVLVLWPRNLNVDTKIHDLSVELSMDYITVDAEEAGYTTDEYGQQEVADNDVQQTAGDHDEGIARNAFGLRHALGILVETRVDMDLRNGPQEATEAEVNLRRVEAHTVVEHAVLRFMREKAVVVTKATNSARARAIVEGRKRNEPVYFGGADNVEPTEEQIQDPPPCGYQLFRKQVRALRPTLKLLGIRVSDSGYVTMAQVGEPVIPLLLDERGARHSVAAEVDNDC